MSVSGTLPLPCLSCGKPLRSALASNFNDPAADSAFTNLPADANTFIAYGNYGSILFDPADGSYLEINICSDCLRNGQVEGRVLFAARRRPAPPRVLQLWDGSEPDEDLPELPPSSLAPGGGDPLPLDLEAKPISAPWSLSQVASLNDFQACGFFHPFTCDRGSHVLRATPIGWICPQDGYTQGWAHDFMCDDSWRDLAPPWEGKASLHLVAKS